MILKDIIRDVATINESNDLLEIDGIASNSIKVKNNYVFVAIKGDKRDGNEYIGEAISKGAKVIVSEIKHNEIDGIVYIQVENARKALAIMWSNYFNNPDKGMNIIAITGTNGKTSSAFFLYNIFRANGLKRGIISTICCLVNDDPIDVYDASEKRDAFSSMTTPDPEKLYSILNIMKKNGVDYVVMEATSHALEQYRLAGLKVRIGAFTNLTQDHLDYHSTMERYSYAKEKLLRNSDILILNIDDEYGRIFYEKYIDKSYSFSVKGKADFFVKDISINNNGISYTFCDGEVSLDISSKMLGEFNIYNSMLAICCARLLGIEERIIAEGIKNTSKISGRIEKYKNKSIYIDYAHTPDAMKKIIAAIKEIEASKRTIVLFGCGGERDKSKRAKMGEIATKMADEVIITSDNSRGEDINIIIEDILIGAVKPCVVIKDRKEAIAYAVSHMKDNDVLLLLGKGHESYEIGAQGKKYFSEIAVLDEAFKYLP